MAGFAGLPGTLLDATSYWIPPRLQASAWHEHAPFAFWLVNNLRPRTIVELGTHNGFSFFVFCEALKRLGMNATAVAIDSWEGDEHAGFYGEEVYESVTRVSRADYDRYAVLKRGYFDDFVDGTADGSIDLLHIDGRHRYEDVTHDFTTWLPKVSDRGVVILHDTAEHREDFGVWRFWEDVRQQYPSFGFNHGHGLGVLLVGERVPPAVAEFVAFASANPEEARRVYHDLGRRVGELAETGIHRETLLKVKTRLEQEMRDLFEQKREQVQARHKYSSERDALAGQLNEVRRELETLGSEKRRAEKRLEDALGANKRLEHEVNALKSSTSWRFTAPARALTGMLKRGERG